MSFINQELLCDVGSYLAHVNPEMLIEQIDSRETLDKLRQTINRREIQLNSEMFKKDIALIMDYFGCSENNFIKKFSELTDGMTVLMIYILGAGTNKSYYFEVDRLIGECTYGKPFRLNHIIINMKKLPQLEIIISMSISSRRLYENYYGPENGHNIRCIGGAGHIVSEFSAISLHGIYQLQKEKLNDIIIME